MVTTVRTQRLPTNPLYRNIKIINTITAPNHLFMSIISSFRLLSSADGSTSKNRLPTKSKYSTKKIQHFLKSLKSV